MLDDLSGCRALKQQDDPYELQTAYDAAIARSALWPSQWPWRSTYVPSEERAAWQTKYINAWNTIRIQDVCHRHWPINAKVFLVWLASLACSQLDNMPISLGCVDESAMTCALPNSFNADRKSVKFAETSAKAKLTLPTIMHA
eukprot:3140857-Amphidinium_carterae.1